MIPSNDQLSNLEKNILKDSFIQSLIQSSTGAYDTLIDDDQNQTDTTLYTTDYTYYWYNTSDNQRKLEEHLKDTSTRLKLEKNGWLYNDKITKIEYKINRNGFRCDNFTNEPGIIFVGCSNTYGTGLPYDAIWPTIVSNHFNLKSWNLGTPGLSAAPGTFYLLNWHADIPSPKAIVLFEPPPGRFEIYRDRKDSLDIRVLKNILENSQINTLTAKLFDFISATAFINYRTAYLTLGLLAEKLNIPFVYAKSFDTKFRTLHNQNDFARDLMHSGKITHVLIAEYIIDQLEKAGLV